MIHIDRSQRVQAFNKVVQQGRALLAQGTWVIMFPEGTRMERGQKGQYKSGGTRLAIDTGVPVMPVAVTSAGCGRARPSSSAPGWWMCRSAKPIPSRQPDELMQARRAVEDWIEAEMRRLDPEAYPVGDRLRGGT
jgi:1-acyl-sn-glycerol-3-phosphate acyltransferase